MNQCKCEKGYACQDCASLVRRYNAASGNKTEPTSTQFLLNQNSELRERNASLHKQLDERNEASKVWIQSDTQCRAYANQLRAVIEVYEEALNKYKSMARNDLHEVAREALARGAALKAGGAG